MADRTARGLSVASMIASAVALMQSRVAAAGNVVTLDEATQKLLIAIAQATGQSLETVQAILLALQGEALDVNVKGYAANRPSGITGRIFINQINTVKAYRLPAFLIPDDYHIVLKAWPANIGLIYVGFSQLAVTNSLDQAYPLIRNESILYRVTSADALYVSGNTVTDSVTYTVEQ